MITTKQWLTRRLRALLRLKLDRSPQERIRRRAHVLLILLLLALLLVGAGLGLRSYQRGMAEEWADRISAYQVTGYVVGYAPGATPEQPETVTVSTAYVRWRDRHGVRHIQAVHVGGQVTRTKTVRVWIDASGHASTVRYSHSQTIADAITATVAVTICGSLALIGGYWMLETVLRRRRERPVDTGDIDREWAIVEPRWRRRLK